MAQCNSAERIAWRPARSPRVRVRREQVRGNTILPPLDILWERFASKEELSEIALVGSEVLHHLRAAVDYLVYNAAWRDSGTAQEKTQFPTCSTLDKWDSRTTRVQLRGLSRDHVNWIREVQPFNGVGWTADLGQLSNRDKHRYAVAVCPSIKFRVDTAQNSPDPEDPNAVLP